METIGRAEAMQIHSRKKTRKVEAKLETLNYMTPNPKGLPGIGDPKIVP